MTDISLPGLEGTNPLGFLAALGVLDALAAAGQQAALRWDGDFMPHAVISGPAGLDEILDMLEKDQRRWAGSPVLRFPAEGPLLDAKPRPDVLRDWLQVVVETGSENDTGLLSALIAEGAADGMGSGNAKPTHLHFTAGKQQFLTMVRTLASEVSADRLREAVCGPWAYDSLLPSLSWDSRGERLYALRATAPSSDKRCSVPGADWLAFRGLIFYPVSLVNGALRTTACDRRWKRGAFRWPLWHVPATRQVVWSLVADPQLVGSDAVLHSRDLAARGVQSVLQAPIRRNDSGGYGSFGAPEILMGG